MKPIGENMESLIVLLLFFIGVMSLVIQKAISELKREIGDLRSRIETQQRPAPGTTVPGTNAPEKTVPDTTAQEETAPGKALPTRPGEERPPYARTLALSAETPPDRQTDRSVFGPADPENAPASIRPAGTGKFRPLSENPFTGIPSAKQMHSAAADPTDGTAPRFGEFRSTTEPFATDAAPSRTVVPGKGDGTKDFEKYIGVNLFGKIGIFVLILGIGFFLKYAIDNDWLGESMRTALGFVAGAVLLGVAARLRDKYRPFSSLLAGGAFAVWYVTIAVAYHYYRLIPQGWTFALLLLATLLMGAIAIGYDRRELAVVALAGGLAAPFLASNGTGSHIFLFSYLTILHTGMFVLALHKRWWELPVVSFAATYLILGLFTLDRFLFGDAGREVARDLFGFATLFYLLFATATIAVFRAREGRLRTLLVGVVTLNNFLYLLFGLFFLDSMELSVEIDGALPLAIAAVDAGLLALVRRRKRQLPELNRLLLGLTVLFATIAAPIQLHTNALIVCWAAETVLLLHLYLRSRIPVYEYATAILCLLTVLCCFDRVFDPAPSDEAGLFRNVEFLTNLFAVTAFAYSARLIGHNRERFARAKVLRYPAADTLLIVVASALLYGTMFQELWRQLSGDLFMQGWLLFTVVQIATTLRLLRNRFPIADYPSPYLTGCGIAVFFFLALSTPVRHEGLPVALSWISTALVGLTLSEVAVRFYREVREARRRQRFTILLNLLATLTWIATLCHLLRLCGFGSSFSTGLSLALISAGALQMVLGMRRRTKLLRVLALGVFGVVFAKLVIHDLWQWPTIGRIVVFILLGLTLLLLSFLYQRLKSALFREDDANR